MKNTLKVIFLGVIGFGLLVFLTAPEQKKFDRSIKEFDSFNFPTHFEIVGNSNYVKKEILFKNKNHFIVLNHDSLILANKLNDIKNIFTVANISKTPWLIKKLAVDGKLEDLVHGSEVSLVNDNNGNFVNVINLNDIKQNAYFIYKINGNKIKQIYKDDIKLDALQKGLNDDEIKDILIKIKKALK